MLKERHPRLLRLSRAEESLREYHARIRAEVTSAQPPTESKNMLAGVLAELCKDLPAAVTRLASSADSLPNIVSFAEHHASISHPETTNVVANLASFAGGEGASVLSLSCGTTPLDNELFPRGFYVGSRPVALLSNRQRRKTALTAPPINLPDARRRLNIGLEEQSLPPASCRRIKNWFDQLAPALEATGFFWEQLTIINASLGRKIFQGRGVEYMSLPMELVTSWILIRWFTVGADNWVVRALTDKETLGELIRLLDGVPGFFDLSKRRGTVLVWENGERHLLAVGLQGQSIVRAPEQWIQGLSSGTLIPSAGLSMLIISLVLGFPNFGGLLQYDYLATARQRLLSFPALLNGAERRLLAAIPDSYYVNFEARPATGGGLLRIREPITWDALRQEEELPLREHTRDCISWLKRFVI